MASRIVGAYNARVKYANSGVRSPVVGLLMIRLPPHLNPTVGHSHLEHGPEPLHQWGQ